MGLMADVLLAAGLAAGANYFTEKENYATIGQYEDEKIQKRWYFEYLGMYYWFLFLAFVYVPYGKEIQGYLCDNGWGPLGKLLCLLQIPVSDDPNENMFDIT